MTVQIEGSFSSEAQFLAEPFLNWDVFTTYSNIESYSAYHTVILTTYESLPK